jgi:hypothetical protein
MSGHLMARYWRDWLSGGSYLVLIMVGLEFKTVPGWAGVLAVLLALAVAAWTTSLRRLRAVADTPTSRVASAAQGYVELVGVGRAGPDGPLYSPAHHLPCLWYRYRAYVRQGDDWRQTESGESDALFILDDGSGPCLLDPIGAEVLTSRKERHTTGDSMVEEELLLAGDRLYALGEFTSHGGGHRHFDEHAEVGRVLAEWKQDRDDLHRRFDLDGNGEIDPQEWQLARQAARRETASRRLAALSEPVSHILSRPRHGRPHLIANFPPETLAGRYRARTWLHGLAACASLVALAITLQAL